MTRRIYSYYNDIDEGCCEWVKDLIKAKLIPDGYVDNRSIHDVRPDDLREFTQVHMFCGVAGWPLALRLAGVPDWWPLWTGSAPCQPFSQAGKQKAQDDERHLWPVWFGLVRQRKPPVIFGEQVANSIGHGWLDDLQNDMEREGYALGKAVLGAFSVRSPHLRKRLYFVADSSGSARMRPVGWGDEGSDSRGSGEFSLLADSQGTERQGRISEEGWPVRHSESGELGNNNNNQGLEGRSLLSGDERSELASGQTGSPEFLAYTECGTSERHRLYLGGTPGKDSGREEERKRVWDDSGNGFWSGAKWIWCRDNKFRPTEPVTFPLAYGLPRSMGAMPEDIRKLAEVAGLSQQDLRRAKTFRKSSLRGWGNAIVPQVAAVFIQAYYESIKRTKSCEN